ncbi:MAG: hypothetical protein M1608_00980, partial [Candidatus Omnitrophica bacterium]|nr:hypothetical protein [Candidatus Omnitrophota bacterium]
MNYAINRSADAFIRAWRKNSSSFANKRASGSADEDIRAPKGRISFIGAAHRSSPLTWLGLIALAIGIAVAPMQGADATESQGRPYQRWLWIELIGFDNTQADFGVQHFIDNAGFAPDAVSLLLFSPDFVHAHGGMGKEWAFPPEYCSYGARPYSKEHARQVWTNYQLRDLIAELHRHHIQVYCSFFDMVSGAGIASGKPQWLANNNAAFPVTLTLTLPAAVTATKLELFQSDWPSGDYRSGDFAVDVLGTDSSWKEVGHGRLPNLPGAGASVSLPVSSLSALRIRILNTQDTTAAMSCGLRRVRLWAGTNEISLTSAKVAASSTIPGHEEQQILTDEKAASGPLAYSKPAASNPVPGRWANQHSEIYETRRAGDRFPSINPLRRFQDGTYYEDFFLSKLIEVMRDYGFDGYHGADGYSSGRQSLVDVDYSEDMVKQFVEATKIELPPEFNRWTGGLSAAMEERANWIWDHRRAEWIGFYADRWEKFWRKIVTALHSMGKKVVFNTAWTRDPFEALYRYGVDYQRIARTGIDGFIVESVASAITLGEDNPKFHYDALAMLMLIKAYAPQVELRPFTLAHDTLEQWDALRHAPTVVEREIYETANLYWYNGEGDLRRCSAGPMVCLSDCIQHHEWQWLDKAWQLGFSFPTHRVIGATLVWSDAAFEKQLPDYLETRLS